VHSLCEPLSQIPLQAGKTAILAILYSGWALASAVAAFAGGAATNSAAGTAASAAAGWAAVGNLWPGWRSGSAWALLAFSAVGPGAVADLLQQVGQTAVGAAEANVILTSESLFTVRFFGSSDVSCLVHSRRICTSLLAFICSM